MNIILGLEPFQRFAVVGGGGWWSIGILEFCFGPNLGLRLEGGTKLNKKLNLTLIITFPKLRGKVCYKTKVSLINI